VGPFLYSLGFFCIFGGIFVPHLGKKSRGIFVFFGGIFVFSGGLVFNMILFLSNVANVSKSVLKGTPTHDEHAN
jgi:hypothetical protein